MKNRLLILALLALAVLTSCNDFNRLVKSTDNEMKYEVAVDYYERGDYNHALQLFDLLQASFRNTPKGESITYKTALCYYYQGDYDIAGYYFNRFVQTYPFSRDAEKAAFMQAYCSYMLSPESGLDQTNTHNAIKQLNNFIERYPNSDSLDRANKLLTDLNDKLEEKDYNVCRLFYRMENYSAAITSFENMLKKYPNTTHREEIIFDMAKTYYDYAENSVAEKQRERYESCVEQCNALTYLYPESKYLNDVQSIAAKARKKLENIK
ncbi:MAG: outer membrane protein assembly factor BamD [Bacteroidales bacterium]|nr:outer membrane protein assembly factor BamD [Bacteroidales bacterium]